MDAGLWVVTSTFSGLPLRSVPRPAVANGHFDTVVDGKLANARLVESESESLLTETNAGPQAAAYFEGTALVSVANVVERDAPGQGGKELDPFDANPSKFATRAGAPAPRLLEEVSARGSGECRLGNPSASVRARYACRRRPESRRQVDVEHAISQTAPPLGSRTGRCRHRRLSA